MISEDSIPKAHQTMKTLLPKPSATILIDGLIYTAYNEGKRVFEAGVHLGADNHHLHLEVRADGKPQLLFPTPTSPWSTSLSVVRDNAPYRLYVTSSSSPGPSGLELYKPDNPQDPWSFANILSFEDLYQRSLPLEPEHLAVFTLADGICYSAVNSGADLMKFDQGSDPSNAVFDRRIRLSRLCAIDIPPVRDDEEKWIVFENRLGPVFRFPLQRKRQYEIKLLNVPNHTHGGGDPTEHFLQFYELFKLKPTEKMYLLNYGEAISGGNGGPDFPPCNPPTRKLHCGLFC